MPTNSTHYFLHLSQVANRQTHYQRRATVESALEFQHAQAHGSLVTTSLKHNLTHSRFSDHFAPTS